MRWVRFFLAVLIIPLGGSGWAADIISLAEFAKPGRVLMLRHANAPGTGDPPNFKLDDCTTQRNLDRTGREQALALGKRIAKYGVKGAVIYSSLWCRCLETAKLLNLGPVTPQPALNSFYARSAQREATLAALRGFLAGLPTDGPPVILVTHQFTISALTGEGVASGGGSVFELNGSGAPRLLGAIQSD